MTVERPVEVELKYAVADKTIGERLLNADSLAGFRPTGAPHAIQYEDRYVDSADGALARAGFAARLRTSAAGSVITIKSTTEAQGSLHRREEIEGPADRTSDVAGWPASGARALILELCGDAPLVELVTIRQFRRRRDLELPGGGTAVELSLDEVDVVSHGRVVERFLELELELTRGSVAGLAPLQALLDGHHGLAAARGSKLERALAAAKRGTSRPATEAAPVPIVVDPDPAGTLASGTVEVAPDPSSKAAADATELAEAVEHAPDELAPDGLVPDGAEVTAEPDVLTFQDDPELTDEDAAVAPDAGVAPDAAPTESGSQPEPERSERPEPDAAPTAARSPEPERSTRPEPASADEPEPEPEREPISRRRAETAPEVGRVRTSEDGPVEGAVIDLESLEHTPELIEEAEAAVPLVLGPPAKAVEIGEIPVGKTPGVTADDLHAEAGRKVLRFHLARMIAREPGTREGNDPEELHAMRVSTRRMRAAWRVFGDGFRGKRTARFRQRLRILAARLGTVRDLDVLIEATEEFAANLPTAERAGLDPLIASWREQRDAGRRLLVRELDSGGHRRFLEDYRDFVLTPGADVRPVDPTSPHRVRDTAGSRIWSAYERVRAYESVLKWADVPTLHQLRIEAKRLRYTLEFVREALGPEAPALISRVVALQDHLGAMNDAEVGANMARAYLVEHAGELSDSQSGAISRYLVAREREVARLKRTVGVPWRGVSGLTFRRALGRTLAAL
jgi:CHAD domain-containing protein